MALTINGTTVSTDLTTINTATQKIATADSGGLTATAGSVAYDVGEVERHLHSAGRWFEKATTPDGEVHVADRIGAGAGAFQIDAGNDDWGAWVQILGSTDTPADTGKVYFDPHELIIEYAEVAAAFFVQIARGDSGAAGLAAGTYSELVWESDAVGAKANGITRVQTGRAPVGSKLWARCKVPGQNTARLDFYIGLHEYEG